MNQLNVIGEEECTQQTARELHRWCEAVRRTKELTAMEKLVGLRLVDYSDYIDGSNCFPSRHRLAEDFSLKVRSVDHHLTSLERKGWLRSHPLVRGRARVTNLYQFLRPAHSLHGQWEGEIKCTRPGILVNGGS